MLNITYSIDQFTLQKFLDHVQEFEKKGDNPTRRTNDAYRDMLEEAEALMRNRWRRNFNAGGGIYGVWPPLDEDTVKSKGARSIQPLVTTGKMRSKFFSDMYGKKSARGVEWTFRNYRGLLFHHFGTSHEPARPLVGVSLGDARTITAIARKHARRFVNLAWQQG